MNENDLRFCANCGTRAQKPDQSFCTKCGARFYEEEQRTSDLYGYTPLYGETAGEETAHTTEREENAYPHIAPKSTRGMKWYLFLVMFYMTFEALECTLNAFMYFSGKYVIVNETTPAEYYAKYGAVMKGVDIAYGVILVGMALAMFLMRRRMMKLRKNAPALFLTYYVVKMLVEAAYYVGSIFIKGEQVTFNDVSIVTGLVVAYTAFIILNAVYFKKRTKLFIN